MIDHSHVSVNISVPVYMFNCDHIYDYKSCVQVLVILYVWKLCVIFLWVRINIVLRVVKL
jgi:hypothetical protein